MTHENSPQAYHVQEVRESAEAIREALTLWESIHPMNDEEPCNHYEAWVAAKAALNSLLARLRSYERMDAERSAQYKIALARLEAAGRERDGRYSQLKRVQVIANETQARLEAVTRERDGCREEKQIAVKSAALNAQEVERLREALEEIGKMAGPGLAGTGATGWLLTLEAPEKARVALAATEEQA